MGRGCWTSKGCWEGVRKLRKEQHHWKGDSQGGRGSLCQNLQESLLKWSVREGNRNHCRYFKQEGREFAELDAYKIAGRVDSRPGFLISAELCRISSFWVPGWRQLCHLECLWLVKARSRGQGHRKHCFLNLCPGVASVFSTLILLDKASQYDIYLAYKQKLTVLPWASGERSCSNGEQTSAIYFIFCAFLYPFVIILVCLSRRVVGRSNELMYVRFCEKWMIYRHYFVSLVLFLNSFLLWWLHLALDLLCPACILFWSGQYIRSSNENRASLNSSLTAPQIHSNGKENRKFIYFLVKINQVSLLKVDNSRSL